MRFICLNFPIIFYFAKMCFALQLFAPKLQVNNPIVILPGFGNDIIDYEFPPIKNFDSVGFSPLLQRRGITTSVVPVQRKDWIKVAKGAFTTEFWTSSCKPNQLFQFYFDLVDVTVRNVVEQTSSPVILVAHSAGGWLARAIMGDDNWCGSDTKSSDLVAGLVTLGAPHYPPIEGFSDMTRGALKYVNENYPNAYLKEKIFYITIAGTAVKGNINATKDSRENLAFRSYRQVTGESRDQIGDGIVPLASAHLDGATKLTLPGVYHSIDAPNNMWYGGEKVIDMWLPKVATIAYQNSRIETKKFYFF